MSQKRNDGNGTTAIEYGLIAALIALAITAGVTTLGENVVQAPTPTTSEQTK